MAKKKKELSFEEALHQLEMIVESMEKGDLLLEEAIAKFEEGMKLSKYCMQKLDETEKRINLLTQESEGNLVPSPFSPDSSK